MSKPKLPQRDHCHYVRDGGERVLIPGCMGSAVYGIRGCTCPPKDRDAEFQSLKMRVEKLEQLLKGKQ